MKALIYLKTAFSRPFGRPNDNPLLPITQNSSYNRQTSPVLKIFVLWQLLSSKCLFWMCWKGIQDVWQSMKRDLSHTLKISWRLALEWRSGVRCYGLWKNTNVRFSWNRHTMVFVTNKISQSSFRRFSFFRILVNISQTKKSRSKIFFIRKFLRRFWIFFQRFFCSAEDFFVRYHHFLFLLTFFSSE